MKQRSGTATLLATLLQLSLILIPLVLAPQAQAQAQAQLLVEQPERSHGYFIGDVLLQRINLQKPEKIIVPPDLHEAKRVDAYLYRLPIVSPSVDQQWLELRYQIINAPQNTTTINLPEIPFTTNEGTKLSLPPWQFTVSLLTGPGAENNRLASSLIPDRQALDVLVPPNSKALIFSAIALIATLLLWLLWWLYTFFNDARIQPFAKARRAINQFPRPQRDSQPQALIALHHAFNHVAGKTISTASLPQLFEAAPWLQEYRSKIEHFYTLSAERFFQQTDAPSSLDITDLSTALYRAEKRHATLLSDRSPPE